MRTNRKLALAAAVASVIGGANLARATAFQWDGGATPDTNWSTGINWAGDPLTGPAAATDTVAFDNLGVANLANTVDPALTGTQFQQLLYRQDNGSTYTTSIDRGVNLTLSGLTGSSAASLTNSSLIVMPTTTPNAANAQTISKVAFTSSGVGTNGGLRINSGNVIISGRPRISTDPITTNVQYDSYAIVDMTGLDSFTYQQAQNSVFTVGAGFEGGNGDNGAEWGRLLLSPNTTVNINRFVVGSQNNPIAAGAGIPTNVVGMQPVATLMLNASTKMDQTLGFGNMYVAADPTSLLAKTGSGAVMFMKNVTNPVFSMGLPTSRTTIDIGIETALSSNNAYGVFDGTSASGNAEGSFDAYIGRIRIGGLSQGTSGSGGGYGMLSIDKGTLDIDATAVAGNTDAIRLGYTQAANTGTGSPGAGILNVGLKGNALNDAGQGTITAIGNLIVGQRTHATSNTAVSTGIVNLANAGSMTFDRVLIGNNTQTGTGATVGIVNLGGGSLTTGQIKAGSDALQTGVNTTRIVNLNGGTVKVKTGSTFAGAFMEGLTTANVYAGGGTIDTNGLDTVINQPLVAPAGQGISQINVVDGGSKYRAAPVVTITGGGGVGATAVAQIDDSGGDGSGKVIGITVTNPGTGYDPLTPPTVNLFANGAVTQAQMVTPFGGSAATTTTTIAPNVSGGITKVGAGKLTLGGNNTYAGATTVNGGTLSLVKSLTTSSSVAANSATLELPSNGTYEKVIKTGNVSVSGTGKIDLSDNKMIVTGGAAGSTWNGASYSGVAGLVASGYNGGTNDGSGIVTTQSNAVSPNVLTQLVTVSADDAGYAGGTFGGQSVASGDQLVMYTWGGDANLDGTLNGDDYFQIDSHFNQDGLIHGYFNGDFNYDGAINGDDYFIIDSNFNAGSSGTPFPTSAGATPGLAGVTAVPEPASIAALGIAACGLLGRRRRSR